MTSFINLVLRLSHAVLSVLSVPIFDTRFRSFDGSNAKCAFRRSRSLIPCEADRSFQVKPIT